MANVYKRAAIIGGGSGYWCYQIPWLAYSFSGTSGNTTSIIQSSPYIKLIKNTNVRVLINAIHATVTDYALITFDIRTLDKDGAEIESIFHNPDWPDTHSNYLTDYCGYFSEPSPVHTGQIREDTPVCGFKFLFSSTGDHSAICSLTLPNNSLIKNI